MQKVKLEEINGILGKECVRCFIWKPLEEGFTKHRICLGGRSTKCKECRKIERQENKEAISEYGKRYRSENKEQVYARHKAYRENHKDLCKTSWTNYYARNREKRIAKSLVERADKLGVAHDLKPDDITEIMNKFNDRCPITGNEDIQLDHFIPISKGGCTSQKNIYPIDRKLNASKHNLNPFEWAEKKLNEEEYLKFNKLVHYLASINKMSEEQFTLFVNSHFEERG